MNSHKLEGYGYGNEKIFLNLEQRIMDDVARRIYETGVITRSADFQLNQLKSLGYSDRDIKRMLNDTLERSEEYLDNVYEDAIKTDYISNKELYKATGTKFIPYEKNDWLKQMVLATSKQTKKEMRNMSNSLGFVVSKNGKNEAIKLSQFYKNTLDDSMSDIMSGTFNYQTSLKKAVTQMTNSGLRWIDYDSGHHNRVTVAARRSVMSGMSGITSKVNEMNAEKLGTNNFEVDFHANARPTHANFQGRVFSKRELVDVCGLGSVTGLCGANCYHNYTPFILGISKRMYTEEWLKEQSSLENIPREYNGKEYTAYEATQRQRQIETNLRASRERVNLLSKNGGSDVDILNEKIKYRRNTQEYASFSKAMGLREQRDRIYMDGLGKMSMNSIPTMERESFLIKAYTNSLKKGEISSFVRYGDFEKMASKIEKELLGLSTKDGIMIKGYSQHFVGRVIGQHDANDPPIKGMRSGVRISDIQDTIKHGQLINEKTNTKGELSYKYYFRDTVVTINPKTSKLIQTNTYKRR